MKIRSIQILFLFATALFFASCAIKHEALTNNGVASNGSIIKYSTQEETSVTAHTRRLWILFIPIGGRLYETRKDKAIKKFLEIKKADGFVNGKIRDRKITLPLIVVTYSSWSTKLTAKPAIKSKE